MLLEAKCVATGRVFVHSHRLNMEWRLHFLLLLDAKSVCTGQKKCRYWKQNALLLDAKGRVTEHKMSI